MTRSPAHRPPLLALTALTALATLAASGCRPLTAPDGVAVRVEWSVRPVVGTSTGAAGPAIGLGPGTIVVAGAMLVPTLCYTLDATATRVGDSLTTTVTASPRAGECGAGGAGMTSYAVRLGQLPAGRYRLRVVQIVRDTGLVAQTQAYEGEVDVR